MCIRDREWFVDNTPKDLHVLRMFVKPEELAGICRAHDLAIETLHGSRPRFRWPLWRMLLTGKVGDDFAFTFTPSIKLGYTGYARKGQVSSQLCGGGSPHCEAVVVGRNEAPIIGDC